MLKKNGIFISTTILLSYRYFNVFILTDGVAVPDLPGTKSCYDSRS